MKIESNPMAEFFERIGQRSIKSESCWWHEVQPRVLLSFPYYKLIEPDDKEIAELFSRYKLRAVRFPTPLEAFGFPSAVELGTDPNYDLSYVQPRVRRYIRKSLKICKVEQIDFDYLLKHGLPLNRDTASRQGRKTVYTDPAYWRKYCEAAKATPGIAVWAAMVGGQLGTYVVTAEFDGWWNWLLTHSSEALSKYRTSHVLFYEASRQFFQNNPDKKICYGLGSLEFVPELDHFKLKMGIKRQRIKQRIVLSKATSFAFRLAWEPFLKALNKLFPQSYTIRKAVAMVRLYRQQSWDVPTSDDININD
jgi:hypothetical protein